MFFSSTRGSQSGAQDLGDGAGLAKRLWANCRCIPTKAPDEEEEIYQYCREFTQIFPHKILFNLGRKVAG